MKKNNVYAFWLKIALLSVFFTNLASPMGAKAEEEPNEGYQDLAWLFSDVSGMCTDPTHNHDGSKELPQAGGVGNLDNMIFTVTAGASVFLTGRVVWQHRQTIGKTSLTVGMFLVSVFGTLIGFLSSSSDSGGEATKVAVCRATGGKLCFHRQSCPCCG